MDPLRSTIGLGAAGLAAEAIGVPGVPVAALAAAIALPAYFLSSRAREERRKEEEARIDRLTGLGNARQLEADVAERLDAGEDLALVLFDLEGFKKYNDSFGYACGDSLLQRLARKLEAVAEGHGRAYRLRGDEFCFVANSEEVVVDLARDAAAGALFEVGEGFMIRCAHGMVCLPGEASTSADALRVADQRTHANRTDPRTSLAESQRFLEHGPRLARAPYDAAELAARASELLDLPAPERETIESAAQLRDVGNMAIPDAVLHKPGRLDDSDWAFIKLHTLVGERLLSTSFDMDAVGKLVRSSHERYDGGGYPDALSGADIPLGARIVFACSSFQDMTSERPHRAALTAEEAEAELREGAGTQFDPVVVDAVCRALHTLVGQLRETAPAA